MFYKEDQSMFDLWRGLLDMLVDCLTNELCVQDDPKEKRKTNQKIKNETHVELYPCATFLVWSRFWLETQLGVSFQDVLDVL